MTRKEEWRSIGITETQLILNAEFAMSRLRIFLVYQSRKKKRVIDPTAPIAYKIAVLAMK